MYIEMYIDMHMDMRIAMCIAMCRVMCIGSRLTHVRINNIIIAFSNIIIAFNDPRHCSHHIPLVSAGTQTVALQPAAAAATHLMQQHV